MFDESGIKRARLVLAMLFLFFGVGRVMGQSAEEIIQKMNEKQTFRTMYSEGTMITTDRFGKKQSTYRSWVRDSRDFLIEFTNPEERGQKVLRVKDQVYLFFPDAEDVIPIHGSALKGSMFGDISYEDVSERSDTLKDYNVNLEGEKLVNGQDCWIINMVAMSRKVPYPRQLLVVRKADFMPVEAEYFARSGRLIKKMEVTDIQIFDNQATITGMILRDQLRKGSSTELRISEIQINKGIDNDMFSLRSLY